MERWEEVVEIQPWRYLEQAQDHLQGNSATVLTDRNVEQTHVVTGNERIGRKPVFEDHD